MKAYIVPMIKAFVLSYIISAASLLVLAALLYFFDIAEAPIKAGVIATYVISCLFSGLYIGRKVKKREYLWGLFVGLLYYSVHMGAVIAIEGVQPERIVPSTALALLCIGSGMMGGMLS